jgi:hypothetical protein
MLALVMELEKFTVLDPLRRLHGATPARCRQSTMRFAAGP